MKEHNTQIRLTISLEGRLAQRAANSNSKKEKKLASILEKKGKQFYNTYNEPTKFECSQSTTMSEEAYDYFVSDESRLKSPSEWKRMSKVKRLEAHLQVHADYISGHSNTKFTYQLLQ